MAKHIKLHAGDAAPEGLCQNIDEQEVNLSGFWQDGPILLTFLRHFGWIHCREWLAQLELHKEEIKAAGLRVVAVGLGQPKHARQFGGKLAPSVTCITNETPELYDTYGIGRGNMLRLVAPDAIKAGARAASKGFTQGAATGDAFRLAATFIVDENGVVRYAHYGKHAGDHPDLPAVLDAWLSETQSKAAA